MKTLQIEQVRKFNEEVRAACQTRLQESAIYKDTKVMKNKSPLYKHLLMVAYKIGAPFTPEEMDDLRNQAFKRSIDGGTMTSAATDGFGNSVVLKFDIYMVEKLSIPKRLRHLLRKFFTAVASYVGVSPVVKVIVGK